MKHLTGLAHIALYTKDMETSVKFYESLGGIVTDQADVKKTTGTNHIKMIQMPGFFLEIIEPHDGSPVTAERWSFMTILHILAAVSTAIHSASFYVKRLKMCSLDAVSY